MEGVHASNTSRVAIWTRVVYLRQTPCTGPLLRVQLQHARDEVLGRRRHTVPRLVLEVISQRTYAVLQLLLGGGAKGIEWVIAAQTGNSGVGLGVGCGRSGTSFVKQQPSQKQNTVAHAHQCRAPMRPTCVCRRQSWHVRDRKGTLASSAHLRVIVVPTAGAVRHWTYMVNMMTPRLQMSTLLS